MTNRYCMLNSKVFGTILFIASALFASPSLAADFYLSSDINNLYVGDQFEVQVHIDTKNEIINAVEGKIKYPTDQLELLDVKIGDSLINFWLDRPAVSNSTIIFSGITPGGFEEKKAYLFSVVFQTKKGGSSTIKFVSSKALLNDGLGTETITKTVNFPFRIASLTRPNGPRMHSPPRDTLTPEKFDPRISNDPAIFNNKYAVYFDTQDKNSGIDHFEILESKKYSLAGFHYTTGNWKIIESPYLLQDQKLRSNIQIKAIDGSGNERIVSIPATNKSTWYQNIFFWCIIVFIISPIIIWKIIAKA